VHTHFVHLAKLHPREAPKFPMGTFHASTSAITTSSSQVTLR
jgi:hypothetical protein